MSSKLSLLLFGLVVMAAIASAMENEEEELQEIMAKLTEVNFCVFFCFGDLLGQFSVYLSVH